jgi:hypothetical protein
MSYGLKYIASYDTLVGDNCRIEILEKNYTGIVYPMELSAEPFKQTYDTDEEKSSTKSARRSKKKGGGATVATATSKATK